MLLGIVLGIGFGLGWLIFGMLYIKKRISVSVLKKQVSKQLQELNKLRTDPVKE
ncbi:Inner membrane protein yciS [Candidatus Enterovibrio escicola]|uniref:Inner membrane protein yciS n=1 Tax=Candidatus Enterovibrio escicola TaxID=1927127 RepID=A0A2A5T7N2_9GAMM|nr:Inner membrane protein yciS [Candidatus Enterovibrio escacola]